MDGDSVLIASLQFLLCGRSRFEEACLRVHISTASVTTTLGMWSWEKLTQDQSAATEKVLRH